jgi:dimethylargininase
MPYTRAIVRPPADTYAWGLTSSNEGPPDLARALAQHHAYCRALEDCNVALSILSAEPDYPDSCFVEDTALVTARGAIALRPGAPSRRGEVESIVTALRGHDFEVAHIEAPGTVDGGDVCDADGHFLIGLSSRTNEEGAQQLTALLAALGYRASIVDLRGNRRLLHLKTGLSYLGDGRLVVTADIPRTEVLAPYELIMVSTPERYAANCLRVGDRVLTAAGYPLLAKAIAGCGYETIPLEMSEFRKMDGSLTCLSLLF